MGEIIFEWSYMGKKQKKTKNRQSISAHTRAPTDVIFNYFLSKKIVKNYDNYNNYRDYNFFWYEGDTHIFRSSCWIWYVLHGSAVIESPFGIVISSKRSKSSGLHAWGPRRFATWSTKLAFWPIFLGYWQKFAQWLN